MTRQILGFVFLILLLAPQLSAQPGGCFDPAGNVEEYVLRGLEYAKGFDIGAVRYWTGFGGLFFSREDGEELGTWKVRLNHIGPENIELCGGQNDVIWARLELNFKHGPHQGETIVLVMRDRTGSPDITWEGLYEGDPCELGGVNCDCPADPRETADCEEAGSDLCNLATVHPICMRRGWGTTLPVVAGEIVSGQLCHQFPIIPRITGLVAVQFWTP